ncbi:hypothetical protein HG536_0G02520 [Torulaspora globosa]|uniref:Kinetochore protein Nuf2 N-terminal domain-containing protein n=1 Tax=Torulaspora globosa TaxID=48254 RepID=A0A7G3ZLK5_9SACH|nr:uncharacterized protein HG536_0G02520 [Torulaspora globosa]QLL34391.1 hypothetical protein HG536_0G02520 [Torulaspora globosa]
MSMDIFPLLDTLELATCLQSCDFSLATEDNIARPTSQFVITLYKQIIDSFMGISPDYLPGNGKRKIEESEPGYGEETGFSESMQVLVLNKICYRFFQNIGVADFNLTDLYRPDAHRTKRILSAVVNYARFREERMFDCNKFISETETLLGQLRSRFDDYNLLQQQIKRYEDEERKIEGLASQGNGDELQALEENNRSIEMQLKKLTQLQESLSIDYNNYKEEKQKLLKELEALGFQIVELDSEREKLKRYSESNMDELENSIAELQRSLDSKREKLATLEDRQRNFHTSTQTFNRVIEEVYDVLQVLSTKIRDSHREEENLIDFKQQLLMRRDKLRNVLNSGVMVKLAILDEQIESQKTKLASFYQSSKASHEDNADQISKLQEKYTKEIVPKIQETEIHIEQNLLVGQVKKLEEDMHKLKIDFQREVDQIDTEHSLLANHMNNYMTIMLERMD